MNDILKAFPLLRLLPESQCQGSTGDPWSRPTHAAISSAIRRGVSEELLQHWLWWSDCSPAPQPDWAEWDMAVRLFALHSPRLAEPGMFDRLPVRVWRLACRNPATPSDRIAALAADPAPYQAAILLLCEATDPRERAASINDLKADFEASRQRRTLLERAEAAQDARRFLGLPIWKERYAPDADGRVAALESEWESARGAFIRMNADPETRPQSEAAYASLRVECARRQAAAWLAWRRARAELLLP